MRLFTFVLIVLTLVLVTSSASRSQPAAAGNGCSTSFLALAPNVQGIWNGTWDNLTFDSHGELIINIDTHSDCTLDIYVEGIFGTVGQQKIEGTYHDEPNGVRIEIDNDPFVGDATMHINVNGDVTVEGTGAHQDIAEYSATGTLEDGHLEIDLVLTFGNSSTAMEHIELDKKIVRIQGDVDCDGDVDLDDFELVMKFAAGLIGGQQLAPCPDLGEVEEISGYRWGDVNCDGEVNVLDALYILAHQVDITIPLGNGPCFAVGDEITAP